MKWEDKNMKILKEYENEEITYQGKTYRGRFIIDEDMDLLHINPGDMVVVGGLPKEVSEVRYKGINWHDNGVIVKESCRILTFDYHLKGATIIKRAYRDYSGGALPVKASTHIGTLADFMNERYRSRIATAKDYIDAFGGCIIILNYMNEELHLKSKLDMVPGHVIFITPSGVSKRVFLGHRYPVVGYQEVSYELSPADIDAVKAHNKKIMATLKAFRK